VKFIISCSRYEGVGAAYSRSRIIFGAAPMVAWLSPSSSPISAFCFSEDLFGHLPISFPMSIRSDCLAHVMLFASNRVARASGTEY
jgi:hypothetical protein